jgi:RNA polymerase sigma factor (sigma-70 family)
MARTGEPEELDALFQAYRCTRDTAEAERLLDHLLLIAERQVIRRAAEERLGSTREDVEDVSAEVKTRLALTLRRRRADPAREAIASLEAYVRTMTRNVCRDFLRQKAGRAEVLIGQSVGDEEGDTLLEREPDGRPGPEEELLMRDTLRRLWEEICRRPPRQRAVLLLDWDDVGHVPQLLQLTGTATMTQIAAALAMSLEELGALWHDLPLDGVGIARRLGVERQQAYNLLMVARRSLREWLKAEDEKV